MQGNLIFLKFLLNKGANWNEKDNEGKTAMHLCTRHLSAKCLALLMKQLQPGAVDDQDSNKVLFKNIVQFLCFVTKLFIAFVFVLVINWTEKMTS